VQSLEESSHDAWIKFYRRDENTPNTGISYYTKGAVVAFLLDARVRRATDGAKSLDDVLRLAYSRYSHDRGFTPEEFRATTEEVAGIDLDPWFDHALASTEELDYTEALDWFGLRFAEPKAARENGEGEEEGGDATPGKAWIGLTTTRENGRLVVSGVKRGTPGYDAGFNVGDEILAIGDYRVRPEALSRRLEFYRPNETVSVLIARRDRLMRLDVTLGVEPSESWRLEADPKAGEDLLARRRAWLGG
jgi:predicted metalloprotease with PDZ domain